MIWPAILPFRNGRPHTRWLDESNIGPPQCRDGAILAALRHVTAPEPPRAPRRAANDPTDRDG